MSTSTPTDPTTTRPSTTSPAQPGSRPPSTPGSGELLRLVVGREIRTRGRSKAYVLSTILTPLLLAAIIVVPGLLSSDAVTYSIGAVGDGATPVLETAETLAREELGEEETLEFEVTDLAGEAEARTALADGDVEVVLLDGESILTAGSGGFFGAGSGTTDLIQRAAGITQLRDSGIDVEAVSAALNADPLPTETLSGEAGDAEEEAGRSIIAYGGMMLLYISILMTGQWTLTGVIEEKSSRVVEVLLSTVKPWQLFAGKILGIGLLALGQLLAVLVVVVTTVRVSGSFPIPAIPVDSALTVVVWFLLGYALYSVCYATAGALVSRIEDAQSTAGPIGFLAVGGFLASFQVLDDPSSVLAQVFSWIPFTAPYVVPIRVAFREISTVEYVGAAVTSILVTAIMVRIAARIYAGGLLQFGGRVGLKQAWSGANETRSG